MSRGDSVGETTEPDSQSGAGLEQDAIAAELQQLYEHVLEGKYPEAVGATEQLARQLGIEIERPDRFPDRKG